MVPLRGFQSCRLPAIHAGCRQSIGPRGLGVQPVSCRDRDDEARGTFVGAPRVGN